MDPVDSLSISYIAIAYFSFKKSLKILMCMCAYFIKAGHLLSH